MSIIRLFVITLLALMDPMPACQWSRFCYRTMFSPILKALFQRLSLFRFGKHAPFGSPSAGEGPHFTKNWVPILTKLGPHGMWPQCIWLDISALYNKFLIMISRSLIIFYLSPGLDLKSTCFFTPRFVVIMNPPPRSTWLPWTSLLATWLEVSPPTPSVALSAGPTPIYFCPLFSWIIIIISCFVGGGRVTTTSTGWPRRTVS